ncbi:MAG: endonuclease/exonuclease/phosphatase family protein [Armatimonadota bacterium]
MENRERAAGELRVMSFNVLFDTANNPAGQWEQRRPLVRQVIHDWQPDVIGVQEATPGQLRDLCQDLPEYGVVEGRRSGQSKVPLWIVTLSPLLLGAAAAARSRAPKAVSGTLAAAAAVPVLGTAAGLIASGKSFFRGAYRPVFYRRDRLRLRESDAFDMAEPIDDPLTLLLGTWLPRTGTRVRLETLDGRAFSLFNVHIDYMRYITRGSIQRLRDYLDAHWDGTPQILTGDFNVDLDSEECAILLRPNEEPGMESSWCIARERLGPEITSHQGLGIDSPHAARADHVMLRPGLPVARVVTVTDHSDGAYPSDHFPVVVDLCLETTAAGTGVASSTGSSEASPCPV